MESKQIKIPDKLSLFQFHGKEEAAIVSFKALTWNQNQNQRFNRVGSFTETANSDFNRQF